MSIKSLFEIDGGHGIGKREESALILSLITESIHNELVLMIQHLIQACATNVALEFFSAIDGIGEVLIISAHRFRNGVRSTAYPEEMTRDFLASSNLSKSSIDLFVKVDS